MSSTTVIYDNLITMVQAKLPDAVRLSNSYTPEDNTELILVNGFGVQIGPATNQEMLVGCKASFQRDYTIVLTRFVYATENDDAAKASAEKELMEDLLLVAIGLESDPTLAGAAVNVKYTGDSGIEFLTNGQGNCLVTRISLQALYFETLN